MGLPITPRPMNASVLIGTVWRLAHFRTFHRSGIPPIGGSLSP